MWLTIGSAAAANSGEYCTVRAYGCAEDLAFTLMECERRTGAGGEVPASGMLSGRSADAPDTLDGIKLLTQCFTAHADNVEVVEAMCTLINELIKHGTCPVLLWTTQHNRT